MSGISFVITLIGIPATPDGSEVKYQYDQVGNRTKMFNIAGTTLTSTNYYYNSANELTKTNVNDGEFTQYKYDANGNRVAKIAPDNVVTKYTWDYENRLTNIQMHQGKFVDYEYDGDGNRISKIAGVKQPLMKDNPNQGKVNKQQADIIYNAANNGNGNDGNNGNSNAGGNGNGNGNNEDNGNAGGNGKGNDKDDPDGDKNGNGKGKGNAKDLEKAKNKDLTKEQRNNKKENAKQGKGYRQKGKNTNRGKHLGWYKDKNKDKLDQQIEETYYLNDVSSDLSQVMMTYNDSGNLDTAYTYGVERIGIDILDGTRPDVQNPLYYLYDGQGSVTYVTKPDGEKRDTYTYDEFGKPRTGKLSPDGDKILHTSFGYNGEQWDEESRLQYLRARYYEPETGRFLSRDTYEGELANPLSKHLYAYVQNNPVNYRDPSGHFLETGFDILSFSWSVYDYANEPTFWNGVSVITDAAAILIPGVPGGLVKPLVKSIKNGTGIATGLVKILKKVVTKGSEIVRTILKYIHNSKAGKLIKKYWDEVSTWIKKNVSPKPKVEVKPKASPNVTISKIDLQLFGSGAGKYINKTTSGFWKSYNNLPKSLQKVANEKFKLFKQNPNLPGLNFEKLKGYANKYSVRINEQYRAIGELKNGVITWTEIIPHNYDRI